MDQLENSTHDSINNSGIEDEETECIDVQDTNSNSESNESSSEVQPSASEQDMMNMFASVWVKVEVGEVDENSDNDGLVEIDPKIGTYPNKRKKSKLPQRFNCELCGYTTPYRNCLKIHVLSHTGSKPYSCTQCDYTTKYQTALNRHKLIKHKSEGQLIDSKATMYKCDQCDYATYYKWNLNSHKQKHKSDKKFKCTECEFTTAYRHHFIKHTKRHIKDTNNMVYKCDLCPFVTRFDGHITRHLAKLHNIVSDKANRCDFCDFSTKVNWRLTIHKTRSKQEEVLKCSRCDFETYYMCESKLHKRIHYNELVKSKIDSNNVVISSQGEENEKETSYEEPELPKVDGNVKQTWQNYTLDPNCDEFNNIEVIELPNQDRPFKCHVCSYTARFKASVQRHYQRKHTGVQSRPYKCNNCDFSTKTKDQIALHNKRSLSITVIHCPECTYSTQYKCQFVMHQRTHYDYQCPNCEFKCKKKYDLQKHFTIIHLGDGLKCRHCNFRATRKDTLLSHETTHTGLKPFKCSLCDYTSVRKSSLRNHMNRNHEGVTVPDNTIIVSDNKIQSLKFPVNEIIRGFESNNVSS